MRKILFGLLLATIAISAWGLIIEEATAGDLREDFTVEVIARREPLGVTVQPITEGTTPKEERAPLYEPSSSEPSEDRSDD